MSLTLSRSGELLATTTSDPHLIVHAANVRGCIDEDRDLFEAVEKKGWLSRSVRNARCNHSPRGV